MIKMNQRIVVYPDSIGEYEAKLKWTVISQISNLFNPYDINNKIIDATQLNSSFFNNPSNLKFT